MAFLRVSLTADIHPVVRGVDHVLRPPTLADYANWAELRARSRDHLTPWEPEWARDELSRTAFRRRLRVNQRDMREDLCYSFLVLRRHDEALLGALTLSNIRRGVSQSVSLGYWIGLPHAGGGHMTAAVALAQRYAFQELRLHRIEAACQPCNLASIRVLEKSGFEREGAARNYLRINGNWRDHVLFGLGDDDWRAALAAAAGGVT